MPLAAPAREPGRHPATDRVAGLNELRSTLLLTCRHRAYCDAQGRYLHVPAAAAPQLEQRLSLLMQERTRRTSSGRMLLVFNGDASSEPSPGPSPRHTPGLASPRNSDASLAPAGSSSSGALWQQWGASPVTWQSFAQPPQPQPQPQAEEAAAAAGVRRRSRREQEEGGAHLNLQPFMNRAPSQARLLALHIYACCWWMAARNVLQAGLLVHGCRGTAVVLRRCLAHPQPQCIRPPTHPPTPPTHPPKRPPTSTRAVRRFTPATRVHHLFRALSLHQLCVIDRSNAAVGIITRVDLVRAGQVQPGGGGGGGGGGG